MRCKIFIPIFVVATIILGFLSSIFALLDRSGHLSHLFARYWSRFVFWGVGIHVTMTGTEHIPKDTAVIFAANHQSTMDIPAMFGYLPVDFRIMAKKILFQIPFLGWHLYLAGNIAIDRKNPKKAFRGVLQATSVIKKGVSLLVFMEGTRTRDGKLHRFKRGSFTLARKLGAPILPVAIQGTFDLMPAGSWTSRGGPVEIKILEPIPVSPDSAPGVLSAQVRAQLLAAGLEEGEAAGDGDGVV